MSRWLLLFSALLCVAGCDWSPSPAGAGSGLSRETPAEPAAAAFSHAQTQDLSGYYVPVEPVRFGRFELDHLFVGQGQEFQAWDDGGRTATFAPVMIELNDTTSPRTPNEMGGEGYEVSPRVLPSRYLVTDDRVVFEGDGAGLGRVRFEGRVDGAALATARRNLGGGEAPVLTGRLTVGGRTETVSLRWYGGD